MYVYIVHLHIRSLVVLERDQEELQNRKDSTTAPYINSQENCFQNISVKYDKMDKNKVHIMPLDMDCLSRGKYSFFSLIGSTDNRKSILLKAIERNFMLSILMVAKSKIVKVLWKSQI